MKKLLVATLAMGMLGSAVHRRLRSRLCRGVAWTNAHCKKNNATTDDNIGGSSAARRSVMNHEIGHAMGVDHAGGSACNGQPIMYRTSARSFTCGHIEPQADDVDGINAIYEENRSELGNESGRSGLHGLRPGRLRQPGHLRRRREGSQGRQG